MSLPHLLHGTAVQSKKVLSWKTRTALLTQPLSIHLINTDRYKVKSRLKVCSLQRRARGLSSERGFESESAIRYSKEANVTAESEVGRDS